MKRLQARCWWGPRWAGLALVLVFAVLVQRHWNPVTGLTGLLQVGLASETTLLPALRAQPIALHPSGGYDGQYYAQIACDPSLRTPELRTAIDSLPYRARRILLPAAAWALGGGRPAVIVQVFAVLNLGCWLVLGGLLWRLLEADRWRGLAAWTGVMFSAGVLASVRYSLTDLPATLLFVAAMLAAERERTRAAAAWFAASLLTRESMLVGGWGLMPKAWDTPPRLVRAGATLALALVPLVLWMGYVRWQVGPVDSAARAFAWPGVGLLGDWREKLALVHEGPDHLAAYAYSSLLATMGLTAQVVFMVVHFRPADRWWRAGAGQVVLLLVVSAAVYEGVDAASLRVVLPLALVCNVMVLRSRLSSWWLLALNLSLAVGLVDMLNPAQVDLAAERRGESAVVVRVADGCYGQESAGSNCWTWTDQRAELDLLMWVGPEPVEAALTLRLNAIGPRNLVIFAGEREVWRGPVGVKPVLAVLAPIALQEGRLRLRLEADVSGVRAPSGSDPRALSVCVSVPRLAVRPRLGTEPAGR